MKLALVPGGYYEIRIPLARHPPRQGRTASKRALYPVILGRACGRNLPPRAIGGDEFPSRAQRRWRRHRAGMACSEVRRAMLAGAPL